MSVCHYHPDRAGIGVCMRCRVVICAGCSTRVDGINHCHSCLKALGQSTTPATGGRLGGLAALVLLGLAWVCFLGILWLVQGAFAP